MKKQPAQSLQQLNAGKVLHINEGCRSSQTMFLCLGEWPRGAVLERLYQERGWEVAALTSPAETRARLRQTGPAVVILAEEQEHEESGWLSCWKIKAEFPLSQVFVCGYGNYATGKQRAVQVGARAYVPLVDSAMELAAALQKAGIRT